MKERWVRGADRERERNRDRFEPVVEGGRHGLSRELSLALWERVRVDATDGSGRCNTEQAQQRFHELLTRIAARDGRLVPEVGKLTRAGVEIDDTTSDAWRTHELSPRTPGRETLVEVEARRRMKVDEAVHAHIDAGKPSAAGQRALVGHAANPGLGFDDYRVLGLKAVLQRLGANHSLRQEIIAAAADTDRSIAGRATLWREPLSRTATPNGHALWNAAERHSATLYRRAVSSGAIDYDDPAVESALRRRGTGQPLPEEVRRDMERELGVSLAAVRVHLDAVAAQAARALDAEAFTVGEDVFFADGKFAPDTRSGRKLLAHELTHVAQALSGRTGSVADGPRVSQPGEPLEQEADAVAARVERPMSGQPLASVDNRTLTQNRILIPAAGKAGGASLPTGIRAHMEAAFGADFSAVRIHEGGDAERLDALAFAQGTDIHFAPGRFAPSNTQGLELLGHELAHVVQQAQGRVEGSIHASGMSVNDDSALEHEADVLGAKAARGESAIASSGGAAGSTAVAVQRKPLPGPAEHGEYVAMSDTSAGAPAQAKPVQMGPGPKKKPTYIPHLIKVTKAMTGEEYKQAAMLQVFGGPLAGLEWGRIRDSYTPDHSPYTLQVELSLLQRHRSEVAKAKGMDVDDGGGITGAKANAKELASASPSSEKTALLAEIDRRYYAATGAAAETKIKPNEAGSAALWRTIRDEVLFQHKYVANLAPNVKQLIQTSIKGRDLTPADYEQLFRIAKKIEAMPGGQATDYASKVTATTTDLDAFEASLAKYSAELSARAKQADALDTMQNKLLLLEDVYKKYQLYVSMQFSEAIGGSIGMATGQPILPIGKPPSLSMRAELDTQVKAHGFASIEDFEAYIKKFEKAFEQGAANITQDVLAKYRGKLFKEQQRYSDPKEISTLYHKLSGLRTQYAVVDANQKVYARETERDRIPGNWQPPSSAAKAAAAARDAAVESAKTEVKNLATDYPIFQEDDLPVDRRINKVALATASEAQLGGVMLGHVATRVKAVDEARTEIEGKNELIYKMPKLMPQFYALQNIKPGSIFDLIIQDKIKSDLIVKLAIGIALAVVAIALAVVSFGTATPAIIAAGASVAGAGLSGYMAYEEYQEYAQQQKLAGAGLADDPSIVWLAIAIIAAGIDAAAAAKAVSKLATAAKAVKAGPDIAEFAAAVRKLEKAGEIDAKVARAAEAAAKARAGAAQASDDIVRLFGEKGAKAFVDADFYEALVKLAGSKLRQGVHSSVQFMEEVKKARLLAKVSGDMSPEDIAAAKRAWEQAKRLEQSSVEAAELASEKGKVLGRYSHGKFLEVSEDVELFGGNTIRLDPEQTTTITGVLDDTNKVAKRGVAMPGSTVMGENVGGINFLRSPKWGAIQAKYKPIAEAGDTAKYWRLVTDEFWETVNKPWLDEAIARGDKFRFVSDPVSDATRFVTSKKGTFVLDDSGNRIKSIFGRELDYLKSKGYTFLPDGTAVKAAK
jgi:hypothetical protein